MYITVYRGIKKDPLLAHTRRAFRAGQAAPGVVARRSPEGAEVSKLAKEPAPALCARNDIVSLHFLVAFSCLHCNNLNED